MTLSKTFGKIVPVLTALLIAVISMWVYYPSTENHFVWDTRHYLHNHVFWLSSLSTDHLIWMFLSLELSNWHPLTWLSWAVDYKMYGGLDTWGFHLTNNIIHTLNSVLVFVLALVMFGLGGFPSKPFALRTDFDALIAAGLAALLFAVHPQHVESVAWVAERKDLLCQLFMLLSMLAYIKYACDGITSYRWLLISLGLFFLAILSKPMAVTFPLVLLLLDVYPLGRTRLTESVSSSGRSRTFAALLREKIPFFLLSIFLVLITLIAQQQALTDTPFSLRILNASNSIILYLEKLFLPFLFAPHYPYFPGTDEMGGLKTFLPMLLVLGISLVCLYAWKQKRYGWIIAWLFYLGTLSPVLGLVQVGLQGAADRYAYFPTLPAYLLVGAGILTLLEHGAEIRKLVVLATGLILVILLAGKTSEQIKIWEDGRTLWTHQLDIYPNSIYGKYNLGIAFFDAGQYQRAAAELEGDWKHDTLLIRRLAHRGLSYLNMGRYEPALHDFELLRSILDEKADAGLDTHCLDYNIGWLYLQKDMMKKAQVHFARVDPDSHFGSEAAKWINQQQFSNLQENALSRVDSPDFCKAMLD